MPPKIPRNSSRVLFYVGLWKQVRYELTDLFLTRAQILSDKTIALEEGKKLDCSFQIGIITKTPGHAYVGAFSH